MGGVLGVVLDLQAQAADVHIHDLQLAEVVPAPDLVQDLLPAQGLPRVLHKELHDGVLHLGELDPLAVFLQGPVPGVQQKRLLIDLPGLLLSAAPRPAEQGVHPGGQLRRGKGLGHIVVGAGHEARHLVHLLAAGRQHDDSDTGIGGPNPPADLKPVDSRQHDVQQRHPDVRVVPQLVQGLLPGLRLDDGVPRPGQVDDDKAPDTGFVLQDQHFP